MKNPGQSAECRHDVTVLVDRALKKLPSYLPVIQLNVRVAGYS